MMTDDDVLEVEEIRQLLFAAVDKNLANYPIARDIRLKPDWQKVDQHWQAELISKPWVDCILPLKVAAELKRFPSATDINVLLALLCYARMGRKFRSQKELLEVAGLSNNARDLRLLESSLEFWQVLQLVFATWWDNSRVKDGQCGVFDYNKIGKKKRGRVPWQLPPPIERRDGYDVTMSKAWLSKYTLSVPLPLPRHAAVQNLLLWLLVRAGDPHPETNVIDYRSEVFYNKVGLKHHNRAQRFRPIVEEAKSWLEKHGGCLDWCAKDGRMVFCVMKPKSDWKRKTEQAEQKAQQEEKQADDVAAQYAAAESKLSKEICAKAKREGWSLDRMDRWAQHEREERERQCWTAVPDWWDDAE